MSEPLKPERLAEIKARCEGATPGPWLGLSEGKHRQGIVDHEGQRIWPWLREEDMRFAYCAREDVPTLLAEVERLRALHEQAAALVEAHETGDGSNLCEMLAAKIRALLPSQ